MVNLQAPERDIKIQFWLDTYWVPYYYNPRPKIAKDNGKLWLRDILYFSNFSQVGVIMWIFKSQLFLKVSAQISHLNIFLPAFSNFLMLLFKLQFFESIATNITFYRKMIQFPIPVFTDKKSYKNRRLANFPHR